MFANKRALFCVVLCVALSAVVTAQSNDRVDELLAQPEASWASTAYIVLSSGTQIGDTASQEEAYAKLKELSWFQQLPEADAKVSIQDLSFLVMKSLGLNGGAMYGLFPSPRYAFRELVFLKIADGGRGPERIVSGAEVLRVLGAALERKAAGK